MDLHAPLGQRPPTRRRRILPILSIALLLAAAAALGAYLYQADPQGGEPFAVAAIPPEPTHATPLSAQPDPMPTASIRSKALSGGNVTRIENGVKVTSPAGEADSVAPRGTGPMIIDVSKALDEGARKPPPVDRSKMANTNPSKLISPKMVRGSARPRVAIFVGGMGLSEGATRTATELMPAAVALAFVPSDDKTANAVSIARAKGHEVLLQLPMQNAQGSAAVPHSLGATATPAQTAADLTWLMSRFDGYVGVTNLLGAPVTANAAAMTTILKTVRQRGLFYVDDGTSKRSVAPSVAQTLEMQPIRADVVLDATNDPAAVRANLERLAAIARKNGSAIGVASGLSDHLASIAGFAAGLDSQGLTLVPLSALARGNASLATTR